MNHLITATARLMIENGLTVAFAESATAGRLSWEFSMVKDAGKFLKGGVVCYDACLKESLLNVNPELIRRYTPESIEVTRAIAIGLQPLIDANIHIGITGLTRPGGSETKEKPVGTMFIYACRDGAEIFSGRYHFPGSHDHITEGITLTCAGKLYEYLNSIKDER